MGMVLPPTEESITNPPPESKPPETLPTPEVAPVVEPTDKKGKKNPRLSRDKEKKPPEIDPKTGAVIKFPKKLWWKKKWYIWVPIAVGIVAIPTLVILYFRWVSGGGDIQTLIGPEPAATGEAATYFENPINGVLIEEPVSTELMGRRPLCVMMENLPVSRPQVGFNKADLVYEALAEGGITRMMAVYWSEDAEKLMPIRSARYYYVEWTTDIEDCVYYHIGEAISNDSRVSVRSAVNKYDVDRLVNDYFSRDQECDATKNREHCAYTSTERLWEAAEGKGWTDGIESVSTYLFKNDDEEVETTSGIHDYSSEEHDIHVRLSSHYKVASYQVVWSYDPVNNEYLRSHGTLDSSTELEDALVNEQVSAKNLAFIKTSIRFSGDHKNRNIITVIGSGNAVVFLDGKVIEGTWEKETADDRTKLLDLEGEEIKFNRGRIWIHAMPTDNSFNIGLSDGTEVEI